MANEALQDEAVRLERCAQEQIHVPGAIQPHGALVAVDPMTREIVQVSSNVTVLLARTPEALLGTRLEHLVDGLSDDFVAVLDEGPGEPSNPVPLDHAGLALEAIVHRSPDGLLVVELEPTLARSDRGTFSALHAAIEELSRSTTVTGVRDQAARLVRRLTGFDHVVVYHFHPDGHGEVVAEDVADGMDSYLGLHFPASDIPSQARRLYTLRGSRTIVTNDYEPAALVPLLNPLTGQSLDLSLAELRSVSPHHREFMANMGVAASLSLSLVHNGELIGMITGNHRTRRHLPYVVRRGCESLVKLATLKLVAMADSERFYRQLSTRVARTTLVEQMTGGEDLGTPLTGLEVTLLDLLRADGAVVVEGDRICSVGVVPPREQVRALAARLTHDGETGPVVTDALGADHPDLASLIPGVAGLVVVPLGGGASLMWFRPPVTQTVTWLGDQSRENRDTPFSPRRSFARWTQDVTGRAIPWIDVEVGEAIELRRDVDSVLRRRAEAQLAHLGLHDVLTGLPNRRLLTERLSQALQLLDRSRPVAVLFIDLDRFKLVNDTYGHDTGDQLIVEAGHRISTAARRADTVARLGGDEFIILCENTDGAAAQALAERILAAFTQPFAIRDLELHVTVSIGITGAEFHHTSSDLIREADAAMYASKDRGRNQASTFALGLRVEATRRIETEEALRRGIAVGELRLHYQPVLSVADRSLHGVEALVRWDRPDHGLVPPDDFITLAEETGLIVQLGEWVLGEALSQLADWLREGVVTREFTVAVNVSPRQLAEPSLVPRVEALLARHGIDPAQLILEVTETALITDRAMMTRALDRLAGVGISIALDDFGTGYSSLSYLRSLPLKQLKIDRSFVEGLPDNPRDTALVSALTKLAHEFDMESVAEGVETPEQEREMTRLDCDFMQGYLLGRPAPADGFRQWLDER